MSAQGQGWKWSWGSSGSALPQQWLNFCSHWSARVQGGGLKSLDKATPQLPMSPETKTTARRKENTTWWCSLVCFGIQKGSSRCKDCSAPLPGHTNSPGSHVSGCWIWQCSRLSLECPPQLGQEGVRHPSATQGLCTWEVQDGWGARAGHQQHSGCGCSGELQHQQSCAQTSAPPARGTSRGCSHREFTKTSLTQPWAPGTFMGNLQVPLAKQLWLETQVQKVTQGTWAGPRVIPRLPLAPSSLSEGSPQQPCSKADPPELCQKRQAQNLLQNQSDSRIFHSNIPFPLT